MIWPDGIDDEQWRPLAGPGGGALVAALMDAEAALAEAERRVAEFGRTVPGGARLRERIEQDLVPAAARMRGRGDRRRELRDVVSRWKAELGRPPELRRLGVLADRLAALYSSLLIEEFRGEFDVEFAAETPADDVRWKEAEKASKEVERLRRELEKARKAADETSLRQHLRFVPAGGAGGLLRRFVTVWRDRAARFAVPVTLHGTRIDSLSDDVREEWSKAYAKCGCRPGAGEGLLAPVAFRNPDRSKPAPQAASAMFDAKE